MAASDGTRLNYAASLAEAAAELQKGVSARKGKAGSDGGLAAALEDVGGAIRLLSAAVVKLAEEVADPEEGGPDGAT